MNASLPDSHPSIQYYDSDYPSAELSRYPENFDETTELQGLAHDVARFKALATHTGGPVLELCCGSGRVTIPLARAGFDVVGVDVSRGMLDLLRARLAQEADEVAGRVTVVQQDVTALALATSDFPIAIAPFNSLLCITDFRAQCSAVSATTAHLRDGGLLVLDLMNPLTLPIQGDATPKPFFTRRNTHTGNRYTRFAAMGPIDANQVQCLYGWYDEICADRTVRRTEYSLQWRPIFRYELELMLDRAGLDVVTIEGGHREEPFTAASRKMFVVARKRDRAATVKPADATPDTGAE